MCVSSIESKRLRLEDIEPGMDIFVVNIKSSGKPIRKIRVDFGPYQKPLCPESPALRWWIKEAYFTSYGQVMAETYSLSDCGVVSNSYNKCLSFRNESDAQEYLAFLRLNPRGLG